MKTIFKFNSADEELKLAGQSLCAANLSGKAELAALPTAHYPLPIINQREKIEYLMPQLFLPAQ